MNEVIASVIDAELESTFKDDVQVSVEQANESFLKANVRDYKCAVEAAKLIYELNPSQNKKRALELITDISAEKYSKESLDLKVMIFDNKCQS